MLKVTYTLYTPYTDLAVKYKPKVDVFDRGIDGSYNSTEIGQGFKLATFQSQTFPCWDFSLVHLKVLL